MQKSTQVSADLCLDKRRFLVMAHRSLVDEGWKLLNFCIFNWSKINSTSTQFIQGIWSRWNLYNSLVRSKSSSLSPSSSPCLSSGNYSWRLFQKTIKGFDSRINGWALWAVLLRAQVHLGLVRQASTNTGRIWSCLNIQLEQSENDNPATKIGSRLQDIMCHILSFGVDQYEPIS